MVSLDKALFKSLFLGGGGWHWGGSQKDSHDIIIVSFVITLTGRRATPNFHKCIEGANILITSKKYTYCTDKNHFNWLACIYLLSMVNRPNSENKPDFAGYPRACKPMQGPKKQNQKQNKIRATSRDMYWQHIKGYQKWRDDRYVAEKNSGSDRFICPHSHAQVTNTRCTLYTRLSSFHSVPFRFDQKQWSNRNLTAHVWLYVAFHDA